MRKVLSKTEIREEVRRDAANLIILSQDHVMRIQVDTLRKSVVGNQLWPQYNPRYWKKW